MIVPLELIIKIYDSSDIETRIKLNKVFKWSYYFKNPFYNVSLINNVNTNYTYTSFKGITMRIPH